MRQMCILCVCSTATGFSLPIQVWSSNFLCRKKTSLHNFHKFLRVSDYEHFKFRMRLAVHQHSNKNVCCVSSWQLHVCACQVCTHIFAHKWQEIKWEFTLSSCMSFILSINKDKLRAGEGNGLSQWVTDTWRGRITVASGGYETFSDSYRNVGLAHWGRDLVINTHQMTFCWSLTFVITHLERKCPEYENGWLMAGDTLAYATCIANTTGHISLSMAYHWYRPWQLCFSLSDIPVGRKWS